uniref:Citramalyl-CoA lyase n=1 Tax=Molossus molossus TaxID=27622 RepID=A0A7J8GKK5_MOLMO|nr:citramalyl-CoA lyase [Molossus molossus]
MSEARLSHSRTASLAADVPRLGYGCSSYHKYIPRRAVLYVPGNDEKKIQKIPSLNVDCAVLDCEDGVAVNKKETTSDFHKMSPTGFSLLNLCD